MSCRAIFGFGPLKFLTVYTQEHTYLNITVVILNDAVASKCNTNTRAVTNNTTGRLQQFVLQAQYTKLQ